MPCCVELVALQCLMSSQFFLNNINVPAQIDQDFCTYSICSVEIDQPELTMPEDIKVAMTQLFDQAEKGRKRNIGDVMLRTTFCQGKNKTSDLTDITKYLKNLTLDTNFYNNFTQNYIDVDSEGETGIHK